MKIALLARNPRLYSHRRIVEAARARGHDIEVLNTLRVSINITSRKPMLYYRKRRLEDFDAVIPRIGASITFYGLAVLRQFEVMGVYPLNESVAIGRSRDKLRCLQLLARRGIGLPVTAYPNDPKQAEDIIDLVGGAPVVIKLLEGTQGIGVVLGETVKSAKSVIEAFQGANVNILVQQFVKEADATDIRALVIGDRVVAAMRRVASGDEFRSNVHRGGTVEPVELTPAYEQAAVRSAQIMGLKVAGVDMLEGNDGPLVMEVNSSPGLQGIETATKLDVAGAIIDYIANQVAFPEIDVRQRLTVSTGYGVAELLVHGAADLVGKTLGESGLWDRDITVLTLHRGTTVIPNPRKGVVLEAEDRLLCFGRLEEMRSMIPERRRRRAKVRKLPKEPIPEAS